MLDGNRTALRTIRENLDSSTSRHLLLGWWTIALMACGPDHAPALGDDAAACIEGTVRCEGKVTNTCVDGTYTPGETCPVDCIETIGCVVCVPGTGTCDDNQGRACAVDGSEYIDDTCDPAEQESCDPETGRCEAPCNPTNLGDSYIGCEYFPTITGNLVGTLFDFAVAIANTTDREAVVSFEGGAIDLPRSITVPAGSVRIEPLPWVPALKLCDYADFKECTPDQVSSGALVAEGAYHVRSSQPVTVYQFNAFQYTKNNQFSFTNDASLLLPVNVWRDEYYVASWPTTAGSPSLLTVTAREDGTAVTITTRAATVASGGAPAFATGVPQTVTLNARDVIELTTLQGDLTGTHISSTAPVQVIGAHFCANVPVGVVACDHLEESMFSVAALGTHYLVSAPAVTTLPEGKTQIIRIVATAPNTQLTYDPPPPFAPATIANPGDFVELSGAESFSVTANEKILVAQYMTGQEAGGGTGDPSMALAVPVEQFRSRYLFHAPLSYEINLVDVTAPMNAQVTLDGERLTFEPIGTTGYGLCRVSPLSPGLFSDGNHVISGDMKFGITVYGYGRYTSYWYPGGLDLTTIVP